MTQQTSAFPPSGGPVIATGGSETASGTGSDASVKDKAAESAQAGKQAASEVAQTAAGHAKEVAGEAKSQARDLVGEARSQVRSQTSEQHQRAVSNLRALGDELDSMASGSQQNGVATELVGRAAQQAHGVADWLGNRQPEEVLDEVKRFARRRPGAFLLGALAAGVVAGRLARGAAAVHSPGSGDNVAGLIGDKVGQVKDKVGGDSGSGSDDETAAGSGGALGPTPTPGPGGYSMPAAPDTGAALGDPFRADPGAIPGGPTGEAPHPYGNTTYTAPGGRHAGEVGDVPPLGGPA